MKKINTSPVSGMQELLPKEQIVFDSLKNKLSQTFQSYGFFNVETPSIERTEILLAKAGGETEKQIYKVIKTTETADESSQALRFDHTVPLARYVVEHENDLAFPFKVSQIGLSFRGERAQKGRFRELYQCDCDVIGRNDLPISYDADVVSVLLSAFTSFNLKTEVLARISNRKILSGLLQALNLENESQKIYSIIDHAEKVTPEKTKSDLIGIGLDESNIRKILAFINLHGERSFVIKELNNLEIKNELFATGVTELDQVLYLLEVTGFKDDIIADMKIVRGLDYYTGTVFEFILPEYKHIGSVCGGGRYENLASFFSDQSFPGVGGSIGLTRLFYILNAENLLPENLQNLLDYAVIPISDSEVEESFKIAEKLRQKKYNVTVVMTNKKLGDKITYASKIAENGIVIGENEIGSQILKTKNYITGETSEINLEISSNPTDFWND